MLKEPMISLHEWANFSKTIRKSQKKKTKKHRNKNFEGEITTEYFWGICEFLETTAFFPLNLHNSYCNNLSIGTVSAARNGLGGEEVLREYLASCGHLQALLLLLSHARAHQRHEVLPHVLMIILALTRCAMRSANQSIINQKAKERIATNEPFQWNDQGKD